MPSPFRGTSVRDALDSALVPLTAAGVDSPRLDAELLLADALGVDRARLLSDSSLDVAGDAAATFREHVTRRRHREPVAYILGRKGFRHLELRVDSRVLVPRPETETLVEAALELAPGARVLDVGTGSGAVALALKHERLDLRVTASDVSADAVAVARANARRLGLDVEVVEADGIAAVLGGPWDAVVSNPPYVAEGDRPALAPEIVAHEPGLALWAGPDGLAVVRRLIGELGDIPWAAFEVGAGQAEAVAAALRAAGLAEVVTRRDLAGIERVVVARR